MKTHALVKVVVLSVGALVAQGAETPLPITVEVAGSASISLGDALHHDHPRVAPGSELTFLGRYEPEKDLIYFLDPPSVIVSVPRGLYWRIYFLRDTLPIAIEGFSLDLLELDPAQTEALLKLPAIQNYLEKFKVGWEPGHGPEDPRLSLHEVYAGKVPEEFAKLDARQTIVGVCCDNLRQQGMSPVQTICVKPDKPPTALLPGMIAMFSGTIQVNQPELSFTKKDRRKIHYFNMKLTAARPVRVQLDEDAARLLFKKEVRKAMLSLQAICKRESLIFEFDSDQILRSSWMDDRMVVSGLITPYPNYSIHPVPYATVSVCFDPATGKPERIVFVRRERQDPWD